VPIVVNTLNGIDKVPAIGFELMTKEKLKGAGTCVFRLPVFVED